MKTSRSIIEPLESRIAPAVFTVTSLMDTGPGTLRAELILAEGHPGHNVVNFHLPAPPLHGENVITVATPLGTSGNVTINGPGTNRLIVDGNNTTGVFVIGDGTPGTDSPTTITGLTIAQGNAGSGNGGGIFSYESLTLKNVVISGNTATSGGGVYVGGTLGAGTKVNISNCLISSNVASGYGGGLLVEDLKSISIGHSVITGNTNSGMSGGGIFADIDSAGTGIAIVGSTISGNTAPAGSGLFVESSAVLPSAKIAIVGTQIFGNRSTGTTGGGALSIGAGNTVITGSVIRGNTAVYNGGGIYGKGFGSLTISGSSIIGNQTTKTTAMGQGGAGLNLQGNSGSPLQTVKIASSLITDNYSPFSGGAILANGTMDLSVSGSTITGNTAFFCGGGIYALGDVALSVTGSTFLHNSTLSGDGGGIFATGSGAFSVASSRFVGNVAANEGGGISSNVGGQVTVKNIVATNNFALDGGVLAIEANTGFKVTGGLFSGNAADLGGAIYADVSGGTISGAAITGNSASISGGGVFTFGPGTIVLQIAKVIGNIAPASPDFGGPGTIMTI